MLEQGHDVLYYENIEGGHGGAADNSQRAELQARLAEAGLIERQIAVLNGERLAPLIGHGLAAIVEITLDRQDNLALEGFERRVAADAGVYCRLRG